MTDVDWASAAWWLEQRRRAWHPRETLRLAMAYWNLFEALARWGR